MALFKTSVTDAERAEARLSDAKKLAQSRSPFFSYLLYSTTYVEMEPEKMAFPTMATNGNMTFYCREFVLSNTVEALCTVITHETLHDALLHIVRCNGRDHTLWNLAIDYAVNDILASNGFALDGIKYGKHEVKLCYDKRFHDMPAEHIYEILLRENPPQPQSGNGEGDEKGDGTSGTGTGKPKKGDGIPDPTKGQIDQHIYGDPNGDGSDKDDKDSVQKQESEAETVTKWSQKLLEAIEVSKQAGSMPVGADRFINEVVQPKVKWRDLLRKFMSASMIKTDYSFARPNRRLIPQNIFIPGLKGEHVEIAVLMDTSGSIGQEELSAFMTEVHSIMRQAPQFTMHLICWDAEVQSYQKLTELTHRMPTNFPGGGGTCLMPAVKYLTEKNIRADLCIILTDGYIYDGFPKQWDIKNIPVVYCIAENGQVPPAGTYGASLKLNGMYTKRGRR